MIFDVFLAEILGIFLAEQLIQVFAGIIQLFRTGYQDREIRHQDDTFQNGHGGFIQIFPYLVAHKQ